MRTWWLRLLSLVVTALFAVVVPSSIVAADAKATKPLVLKLPLATLKGTPENLPSGPNIDPPSDDPPPPVQVPADVVNVALGKTVTSSVAPFIGELKQVTDGKKEPNDDDTIEMRKGVQWVQVDLGQSFELHAVAMWHDHRYVQAMRDVRVDVSEDAEFKTGTTTIFNNDVDNSATNGVGTDREYFEMRFGKVVPAKGVKARYVRGYMRGSNQSALNCWQEIEVYALPAK